MKSLKKYILLFIVLMIFLVPFSGKSQGRVVVNEFMPWPGCSTTSEFIELLNFGPGPMNIGCYIVTNGSYAITIPPNTILQPGQYFVLSGQDILPSGCGNADSAVHVNLNWTTCNCTNVPIPTTGDGMMQDGGSANEKVILLAPDMSVVDAVSRNLPQSASIPITTTTLAGGCTSHTFDLDTMNISYEMLGMSTGKNNSFSRKVDGDCGWVKTPAISANAPNKTGSTSSASYSFSTLSASECSGTEGSISIGVSSNASGITTSSLFPMTYTLAYDLDNNGMFNENDQYINGIDNTAPSIDIQHLAYGRYRITVGSSMGCNLQSYDFFIFNCYGVVLAQKLTSFNYTGLKDGNYQFMAGMVNFDNITSIALEGGNGNLFTQVQELTRPFSIKNSTISAQAPVSSFDEYRLKILDINGQISYSPVIRMSSGTIKTQAWPNPTKSLLYIQLNATANSGATYTITNTMGSEVRKGMLSINKGINIMSIPTHDLVPGVYQIFLSIASSPAPVNIRFMKQ